MKNFVGILITLFSYAVSAGIPKGLSYEEASQMGIIILSWENYSAEDQDIQKKHSSCTPLTIIVPRTDLIHPDNEIKSVRATLKRKNKMLMASSLVLNESNSENMSKASGCLPLSKKYEVDIEITYSKKDSYQMCPPQYELLNIRKYFISVYNKPKGADAY